MNGNENSESLVSRPVSELLMAELEAIRKEQADAINGWRLVMLVQMPTFCGIYLLNKTSIVLYALLTIVVVTMYMAEFQRILNRKAIWKYRDKIIHELPEQDMDKFISASYDYRFFKMASPITKLVYRLDLIWISLSTILCLVAIHFP